MHHHTLTDELKQMTVYHRKKPQELIAQAIDIGLEKMWIDMVLSQYLHRKISHQKAAQLLGPELIQQADYQHQSVQNDVKWGLKRAATRHR